MKKLLLPLFSICLLLLVSCSSDDANSIIAPKTSLEITFKDELGNSMQDVVVKLFSSQDDWNNGTNQVGTVHYSDADGVVLFEDISNIKYYWLAEKGCQNNVYGGVTTTTPLAEGKKTTITNILKKSGTLTLTSTSSNPYRIFINGTAEIDLQGNATKSYILPEGTYTVRVLQLSGYILYPTDKTYSPSISCGNTTTVKFP
jgi:archaellum component FlaF (FlaF/FlaG flagellin family)